jgi:NAD(P)-dependent dehydrogenase (short-subunit alcohol dehydrogenase family)
MPQWPQNAPRARDSYAVAVGDLAGKTYLITGANTGIGRETVRGLAARGATVFLAGRSEAKTRPVIDQLSGEHGEATLRFLPLDLGDLASVRECAEAFLATGEPLQGLINNAGLAGRRGLTASGFELMFGTNHVGPFLLTQMLLPRQRESAPSRVVNVASEAHRNAPGIDFAAVRRSTRTVTGMSEYAVSKLANVLHAQELARRLDGSGVNTYALHPGVVASDIWRRVPWPARAIIKLRMRSPEDGARTSLYCATSDEVAGQSGLYYDDCRPRTPGAGATPQLGTQLWEWTAEQVGAGQQHNDAQRQAR